MIGLVITTFLTALAVCGTDKSFHLHQLTSARQVATAGEELLLSCDVQPDLGGLIVWKHGARVLFAGDLKIRRDERLALRDTSLIVGRVTLSDGGEYSCETERSGGGLEVRRHIVEVISRPEVSISGAEHGVLTVKAGARLRLVCRGEGSPRPAVSWWRGGEMISSSLVARSVLHLGEVTASEAGQLTCKADNGVGGPASDTIYLNVLAPPSVTISSQLDSCSLQVTCQASSSTPGWVRMMYSGQVVLSESLQQSPGVRPMVSRHDVMLDICREEAASEVSCQVENRQGTVRDSILAVRERETPPAQPLPLLSCSSCSCVPLLLLLTAACFLCKL